MFQRCKIKGETKSVFAANERIGDKEQFQSKFCTSNENQRDKRRFAKESFLLEMHFSTV